MTVRHTIDKDTEEAEVKVNKKMQITETIITAKTHCDMRMRYQGNMWVAEDEMEAGKLRWNFAEVHGTHPNCSRCSGVTAYIPKNEKAEIAKIGLDLL